MATVLLASDLACLRRELRDHLAGPDLLVEEASSGPEAIARVKRGGVDLVVVDLQVGAMGGMAISMELRNLESDGGAEPVAVLMLLDRRPDVFLGPAQWGRGLRRSRSTPSDCATRCGHRPRRELRGCVPAPGDRPRRSTDVR